MVEILLKISNDYSKELLSSLSLEIRSVEPTIDGDGTQRRLQLHTAASNETARVTSSAQTLLTAEQLSLPVPPEDDD